MKLAGQSPSSSVSSILSSPVPKDPFTRKKEFLRRRRMQADSQDANKVIEVLSSQIKNLSMRIIHYYLFYRFL